MENPALAGFFFDQFFTVVNERSQLIFMNG